jgi:hypothetical protein
MLEKSAIKKKISPAGACCQRLHARSSEPAEHGQLPPHESINMRRRPLARSNKNCRRFQHPHVAGAWPRPPPGAPGTSFVFAASPAVPHVAVKIFKQSTNPERKLLRCNLAAPPIPLVGPTSSHHAVQSFEQSSRHVTDLPAPPGSDTCSRVSPSVLLLFGISRARVAPANGDSSGGGEVSVDKNTNHMAM